MAVARQSVLEQWMLSDTLDTPGGSFPWEVPITGARYTLTKKAAEQVYTD